MPGAAFRGGTDMDTCMLCGSTLVKGVCPHCGIMEKRPADESLYECRNKAAEALKRKRWTDAEIWALKGYEKDSDDKELKIAELLALSEGLRKVPQSPDAEARVREVLQDLGKTVRFRFVTYDLEEYRRLLHSYDLGNTALRWWEYLIGLVLILGLIAALIALIRWIIWKPFVLLGFLLAIVFIWLFVLT